MPVPVARPGDDLQPLLKFYRDDLDLALIYREIP